MNSFFLGAAQYFVPTSDNIDKFTLFSSVDCSCGLAAYPLWLLLDGYTFTDGMVVEECVSTSPVTMFRILKVRLADGSVEGNSRRTSSGGLCGRGARGRLCFSLCHHLLAESGMHCDWSGKLPSYTFVYQSALFASSPMLRPFCSRFAGVVAREEGLEHSGPRWTTPFPSHDSPSSSLLRPVQNVLYNLSKFLSLLITHLKPPKALIDTNGVSYLIPGLLPAYRAHIKSGILYTHWARLPVLF